MELGGPRVDGEERYTDRVFSLRGLIGPIRSLRRGMRRTFENPYRSREIIDAASGFQCSDAD